MARLLIALLFLTGSGAAMGLQDPTRPSGQQTTSAPEAAEPRQFALSSILYGPQRRVAVIDGVPRSEGDRFDGVRLRRIHPARVELVVRGQVREVRLTALPSIRTSK
jgi:MSHA biogenesis protein MshK